MLRTAVADDAKLREIVETVRRARKPLPRWLWLGALLVGVVCAAGFAWLLLQTPGTPTTPAHHDAGSPGFASGALIGILAGFVIGWTLARYRVDHSSRNRP